MDLDTRHLRAFVAVAEEGTFTDAAIALGTSQASISRSVQRLEARVGHRLLARSTRSVALTAAGDRALVVARRMLAVASELEAAVEGGPEQLRLGYAWAALGRHTVTVQRAWSRQQPGDLLLVHHTTASAGLLEGHCDVALVRRRIDEPRLAWALLGTEDRVAVVAADHPLAEQETVALAAYAGQVVAVDAETGTTSEDLWESGPGPAEFRVTHGTDEWLTLIASGRAVGISSEATRALHPRPGVVYRPLDDAPPIEVWLAWWRSTPPTALEALVDLCTWAYAEG